MAEIQFGLMMHAQFPRGDDMPTRSITKGMHYSAAPWQDLQQFPFLSRIMAEAPNMRLNFGLVLLSLHKPLDIAEQIATVDVMSGGSVGTKPVQKPHRHDRAASGGLQARAR